MRNFILVIFSLGLWMLISESITGAPTTVIHYFIGDYNSTTSGKIIRSYRRNDTRYSIYRILYSYEVEGHEYQSDKVNFYKNTKHTVKRFHPGKVVTVHYDNLNPKLSVLEITPLGWWVWGHLISGFLLGFFTLYCLPVNGKLKKLIGKI